MLIRVAQEDGRDDFRKELLHLRGIDVVDPDMVAGFCKGKDSDVGAAGHLLEKGLADLGFGDFILMEDGGKKGICKRGMEGIDIIPDADAHMEKGGDFDEEHYLVMVTKNGLIKRTRLDAYKNIRKSGLIALGLNEGDELAWVRLTDGKDELVIATRNGMAIRFSENDVRPMSRTAMGVKAISLKPGDNVVGMVAAREDACILTVTDKGQGRRTPVSDYPVQGRNGMGKINYKVNDTKGYVCGIKVVRDDEDLILISNDGIIIRIAASDVNVMSRYATGVRVMRLADNDRVVAFAAVEHLDESEKTDDEMDDETMADSMDGQTFETEENDLLEDETAGDGLEESEE